MAVEKEIWVNYIQKNLFKSNPHLEVCTREDEHVIGGKVVHIPQAGAKPAVVKNRASYPATAVRRGDSDIVYVLDEWTSDPTHIPNAETVELSYDKMESVLEEHLKSLQEVVGDEIIYQWLAGFAASHGASAISAAQVIRTTGGAVASHLPSTAGNRKLFVKEDLKKARTIMNKLNIPKGDRYVLMSSDLLDQLQEDEDLKKRDTALELDLVNGVVARLYGFTILERSSTATYTNAATSAVKTVGASSSGTDNDSAVCFHKSAVSCALGEVNFFEKINDPLYYGDVYSALVRMGGRKRRQNAEGIVAIVQDASA